MLFITMFGKAEIDSDRPTFNRSSIHIFHGILGRMNILKGNKPKTLVPTFFVVPDQHGFGDSAVSLEFALKLSFSRVPIESENSDTGTGFRVFLVCSVSVSPWIQGRNSLNQLNQLNRLKMAENS